MLTTEIGKTGEVTVEGHVIGRLDGFMFAPDAAEAGSEAKALQATALKALAGEIDARAEKLSAAADDQFALASDGTLRWTGDAVGKLTAADDVLHPRIRIIADERLTGAPRDAVQARLDLWLKTHIEKILGPMFELSKAEDVAGIARGIAFQLVEALGVLERPKIAAEMKDLDQPSRAVLRKYGVRFGAYHIFFPALLKPGARTLASLLWALKQDDADMNALGGAQHLAASGRTSFPADKALSQDAYRVLGYKLAGARAVRVDILERLADLIRPALAWRPATGMEKPAGAFDGRSFTVTQAMTSLTGSAGEDFASVLRSLGYRMDRRAPLPEEPKPAEAAAAPVADNEAATAPTDAAPEPAAETGVTETVETETSPAEADAVTEAPAEGASASKLPEVAFAPLEEPTAAASAETPASEGAEASPPAADAVAVEAASSEETATQETTVATTVEAMAAEGTASVETVAAATPAEPELVEVWRPAGRHDERRPKHERHRHHRHQPRAAAPEGGAAEAAEQPAERSHGPRRHHRDRAREDRKSRPEGEGAQARGPREERGERPHQRFKGKGKFEGKRDRDRDRKDNGSNFRTFATSAPRERERVADPNSPFAKLAALKEQLGNRKD
ncbi:Superfamily II RNA helicase OS=Afipia felis OX=1035 GN=BN961_03827 PE=3 SV=1 [Afipia felis]